MATRVNVFNATTPPQLQSSVLRLSYQYCAFPSPKFHCSETSQTLRRLVGSRTVYSVQLRAAAAGSQGKTADEAYELLVGADKEAWDACLQAIQEAGVPSELAEEALARGFGWTDRYYWQGEVVDKVPAPDQVAAVLAYLQELGVSGNLLPQLLKEFPFVLACDVDGRLKPNVLVLTGKWRMKGNEVRDAIMRNPLLLGYTVDCGGDCIAECDYCWARF